MSQFNKASGSGVMKNSSFWMIWKKYVFITTELKLMKLSTLISKLVLNNILLSTVGFKNSNSLVANTLCKWSHFTLNCYFQPYVYHVYCLESSTIPTTWIYTVEVIIMYFQQIYPSIIPSLQGLLGCLSTKDIGVY